jgi:hypothetical protein
MKFFKNNNEFFLKTLHPDVAEHVENVNAFNIYSQAKFNAYLKKLGAEEVGEISADEILTIDKIKIEIKRMITENKNVDKDRLEFDLAIIFHSNLKELNWGRYLLDNYGMWRWLSMNFFLKETFWRRGEEKMKKGQVVDSAKATFDHLVGKRIRDIFPRRYFFIGERLFDRDDGYQLLKKLSTLSKESKSGGFGNLILNLIDTKLISPNDHVAKAISEVLFTKGKMAEDKEVVRAFVRYNGFKRRLLNTASKNLFEEEICTG